jgi:phosphatidylglycerophosphatase A
MDRFFKIAATGLGAGYSPWAPGTMGSLVAIPLVLLLLPMPTTTYLATIITFAFLSCWVADNAQNVFKQHDSPRIVIDEVAGMLFTFVGQEMHWLTIATGFVLFRALDIWKPWPCRRIDQRVKGGLGVVLDDVVAGIYANAILWVLGYYFPQI